MRQYRSLNEMLRLMDEAERQTTRERNLAQIKRDSKLNFRTITGTYEKAEERVMKFSKKLLVFLVAFLMIFGDVFFSVPAAYACNPQITVTKALSSGTDTTTTFTFKITRYVQAEPLGYGDGIGVNLYVAGDSRWAELHLQRPCDGCVLQNRGNAHPHRLLGVASLVVELICNQGWNSAGMYRQYK